MTNQINVENQDYFEGYIKMVETSFLCQHRNITCYVDGKKVPYKDRQAYIKYKPKKKGKNTIKIKLCVHNPVTGDVSTINTERIFYAK
jgi:hypothetical protein